jgi:uridine kinase
MEQFSPVNHAFYSPSITPNMPLSLGLTSGFSLQSVRTLSKQPFIIGICGGSCSGKSQITEKLKVSLDFSATVINEFDFYLPDMTSEDNFDNPDCIDWALFKNCLDSLNNKKTFECPQYDMLNHKLKKSIKVFPTPVIIVEGLFVFYKEEIRRCFDYKLFVECPDDVRLGHRVRKFTKEIGMPMEFVIEYYLKYTKIAHERFVEPVKFI